MAYCFKCGKEMRPAMTDDNIWNSCCDGVIFTDTGNGVEIIICDNCLDKYQDRTHTVKKKI